MENDKLYAIILLENQRSVRESVKRGFNDVRRFFSRGGEEMLHGVWDWSADGLGCVQSNCLSSTSAAYGMKLKICLPNFML